MGLRACGEIWLEIAAWRGEHSRTRQRDEACLSSWENAVARQRGFEGRPGRAGEVERDRVAPVRAGLPLTIGRLWAVDSGRGCDVRVGW